MSSNSVNSSYKLSTENPKPDDYLTEEERAYIREMDEKSNLAREGIKRDTDLFELSLNSLLRNWSNNMQAVIMDLSNTIYIDKTIRDTNNIYEFLVVILGQSWNILTKDYRMIYVGITFIFLAILIYSIHITS